MAAKTYKVKLLCDNCHQFTVVTIGKQIKVEDSNCIRADCNYCGCSAFKGWISV